MPSIANPERPTVKDVARAAGVSFSAVAAILRGQMSFREATRRRVLEAAASLGYRRNAFAANLASRVGQANRAGMPIAFLTALSSRHGERNLEDSIQAATECAARLGYALEHFDFHASHARKMARQIHAKGHVGLILSRTDPFDYVFPVELDRYAVVGCGRYLQPPLFHTARKAVFDPVFDLLREVYRRGYRRVGAAVCSHRPPLPDDHARLGAVLAAQAAFARDDNAVPPFTGAIDDAAGYMAWFRRHTPDAVVGFGYGHFYHLTRDGIRVPKDVAFASLHVDDSKSAADSIAGVEENLGQVACAAVELLDQQIRYDRTGPPSEPREVVVPCRFIDGASLPQRTLAAAARR